MQTDLQLFGVVSNFPMLQIWFKYSIVMSSSECVEKQIWSKVGYMAATLCSCSLIDKTQFIETWTWEYLFHADVKKVFYILQLVYWLLCIANWIDTINGMFCRSWQCLGWRWTKI